MTSRLLPVNLKNCNFFDGEQITETDLTDEQTRNVGIDAANENNFFGSGVLDEFPYPPVIFDTNSLNSLQQSLLDSYSFDGQNVYVGSDLVEVSDTINGVNLAIQITGARLDGAAHIKVSIMGDEFGDALIHDDLIFNTNGTQITRGRYKNIRAILFNNFAGSLTNNRKYAAEIDGYNLIGRCVVREAVAMEISADPIIAAQVAQPSMFWSDFSPSSYTTTVVEMLQNAIGPTKSLADLNIGMSSEAQREIPSNDVTTRIGQKFLASGANIQKISILASVKYNSSHLPGEDGYEWRGDIILTLHKLQTEVECPVTPTPDNTIDFDPDPTIIGQIALSDDDLKYQGVVLNGVPQIIDFVFTGSNVSDPIRSNIEVGKYYVFTIGRAGAATYGTLLFEEASDRIDNSYMVIYDGTQWVNITESDMWFAIYGDYIKVSDGIAYDNGIGVQIPRIAPDNTNTEVPYILDELPFYTVTYDAYNYVLLETSEEFSDPEQDQRTGDDIYSRVTPVPDISLINSAALSVLVETTPDPVLLASVRDENPRGNPSTISGETCLPGLANGNIFNILLPDADILQNNLVGSILYPSTSCGGSDCEFRIIKQTHFNDAYGDVNGDGEINLTDLSIVDGWLSRWPSYVPLSMSDGYVQQLVIDGYLNILEFLRADVDGDGDVDINDRDLIEDYINRAVTTFPVGSTFSRTELQVENLLNPLVAVADIPDSCCTSFITPIVNCIPWEIDYFATWIPDLLATIDLRRLLATTYTKPVSTEYPSGLNNFFIPGNLLLEGFILNPDETFYSVDLEINHLSLDIPVTDSYGNPTFLDGYRGILLFDNFVAESSDGLTSTKFPAMKYADGSYVQILDFGKNRVKITAALQSITNEYDVAIGGTIKDLVGLYYDPSTSLLMLYMDDLYDDLHGNLIPALSTKILVTVYLKHAGFSNQTGVVTKDQMRSLLGI
ncbi:MAG: hypothetical protein WC516_07315 [Patescibacteria group bacterium]|jgi:hypothetical protein